MPGRILRLYAPFPEALPHALQQQDVASTLPKVGHLAPDDPHWHRHKAGRHHGQDAPGATDTRHLKWQPGGTQTMPQEDFGV